MEQVEIFLTVALLVTAAVGANIVYTIFPRIPLAFYQIGAGLLLAVVPTFEHFDLEPELFMLLIISPLMFNDGQSTNYSLLMRRIRAVLSLAVGLAMVTIIVGGFIAHLFWANISMALMFALAAIVAPTDSVAVESITNSIEVPEHVMAALKNESLFNDASGIVAFSLAINAFNTGHFSVGSSIQHFLVVFLGGILLGIILGILLVWLRLFFQQKSLDIIAILLPFNLLTPFIVYLLAEHLGLSGILAVVACGVVHGVQRSRLRLTSTENQIVTRTTWNVVTDLLNGFVFVLLGASLPNVWRNLSRSDTAALPKLITVAISLYLLMFILRFAWSQLNLVRMHDTRHKRNTLKESLVLALGGVHGTITLAMAFSLPLTINGQAFPERNAIIFVAGIIILTSLIIPTIVMPLILPHKSDPYTDDEVEKLVNGMVDFAIDRLKTTEANSTLLAPVIETLNSQKGSPAPTDTKVVHQLLAESEEAQTEAITELIENGTVDRTFGWKYNRVQMIQTQFAFQNPFQRVLLWAKLVGYRFFPGLAKHQRAKQVAHWQAKKADWQKAHPEDQRAIEPGRQLPARQNQSDRLPAPIHDVHQHQDRFSRKQIHNIKQNQTSEKKKQLLNTMKELESAGYNAVMLYLSSVENEENRSEINVIRHYYMVRHNRFSQSDTKNETESELFIRAFQFEYTYVQGTASQQDLSPELVSTLQQKISMDQLVYMQSNG
ncbi:NhaP-type Na+ H+ and K+ H+ antiporter [Secundilactobacillus collinoides DSM 20515 = JCM 1123]|uniref:NhaP-type Na+ H+ and K+ H+ antiporter n=2 Tax=Secundilactobacillus collinoides TaxID=33960 RepID=A0A0R2BFH0_SECCO|nr:NhaP-type Na+ H+ and K+ H+ antiporter [Secundilactobacillus collinoides DSM 20515 = JCM 1123]